MRRSLPLLIAGLVLALLGTACGDLATPYAAKVNGSRISQSALDRELDVVLDHPQVLEIFESQLQPGEAVKGTGSGTVNKAFAARMLTRRIFLELIHQEVGRRKLKVTAADLASGRDQAQQEFGDPKLFAKFPKGYRDEQARINAEVAVMQRAAAGAVTDADLREYYDANAVQFQGRCISHILVDTKEQVDQLRTQLEAGADFAAVAQEVSTDPQSGQQGGFLGCFGEGEPLQFVEPFKTEAEKLPVGQLSQPVQTQFGFHLIKVTSGRTFDQVKEEIRGQLEQSGGQQAFNDMLLGLVRKAKIEVNPRFGTFSKEQPIGVIPPEAPQLVRTTTTGAGAVPPGLEAPPTNQP
ncbi:MAG: foldase protein PrsA [Actinomycetota bacterium]